MKKYNEVLAEIIKTYNKIQSINKEIETLSAPLKNLSFREKLEKNGTVQKLGELKNKVKDMEIAYKYLKNNAKIAAFNEFLPVVLEVWNKYANKPYGEKTKQKIYDEIKDRCNCSFYVKNGFNITPLNEQGYSTRYDFTCNTKYEDGERKPLLVENKIQPLEFSDFELWYIKSEYVENIPATIKEIRKLETEAIEKQKELDAICTNFNKLAVDGIDKIYCTDRIYKRL